MGKLKIKNWHIVPQLQYTPEDEEKAILPALIWVSVSDTNGIGYGIVLGWWHWGIALYFLKPSRKAHA